MTYSSDAGLLAGDIAYLGRILADDRPGHPLRNRLNEAVFGVLVLIDNGTGSEPIALHPTAQPDVDLGSGALQDEWPIPGVTVGVHERALLLRLNRLVSIHSVNVNLPVAEAMRQLLAAVVDELASGYTLHMVTVDELGYSIFEREDMAGDLPAAFQDAWSRRAAA